MKKKFTSLTMTFLVGLLTWNALAQTTFSWRNDQNPADNASWESTSPYYFWNGSAGAVPGGAEILFFDGSKGTTMTNNLAATNRFKIIFGNTNTPAARTINGSTSNTFYDYSGTWPRIQNDAVGITHTLNFPMVASNVSGINFELVPMAGPLVFGTAATINNNGRTIQIYGNNTAVDATNKWVRLSGIVSGTGALNVSQYGIVKLNAAHTYTGETQIDNGEVWLETGTAIASGSAIWVGNGGQMGNVAKLFISTLTGGTTFSRNISINPGNTSTRFIGGLNTSNTNTFSGTITGPASATTDLNLEQASGGTTTFSGVIADGASGGKLNIVKVGTGTSVLTNVNTYTGTTTITAGVFRVNPSGNLSNATQYILNGGTLSTNQITAGRSITASTLQLNDNSTIFLSTNAHTLSFTASNGLTWVSGKTITIQNWVPLVTRIYVGNSSSGLTASQLAQITFTGYTGTAAILSTGEIVPATAAVRIFGATGISDGFPFNTLKGAFDAINNNTFGLSSDNIEVRVSGNTTETATAGLYNRSINTVSSAGGSGYQAPTITLTGGTNTAVGTLVTTITNGSITSITMSSGSWTAPPTVTITAPAGGGTTATATAAGTSGNLSFTITNGGTNYGPTATFSGGGGGTGAALNVVMTTGATAPGSAPATVGLTYVLTNPGTGYTSNPTCTLSSAAGGSGASYTVNSVYPAIQYNSLVVYPTASTKSISSTGAYPLISNYGRSNVTIDGRVNQIGSTIGDPTNLTLSSTNTANPVLLFNNDAQNNTIKYCTIKGSTSGATNGMIVFGATAVADNGNGNNIIDRNLITNNTTYPQNSIYASGNATKPNVGNQITNNEFKNVVSNSLASIVILVAGGASSPQNNNFTISGNSIYQDVDILTSAGGNRYFIQVGLSNYGGSHTISGNFIGGSAAQCGGNKMYKAGTSVSNFLGISISTSNGTSSIQNNVIRNIEWTTNQTSAQNFTGISVSGSGNATISGNIIGNNTTSAYAATASIISSIQSTANSSVNLIGISTTGDVDCENNQIGSIRAINTNASSTIAISLNVISKTAVAGTTTIRNNIIGSLTAPHSINDTVMNASPPTQTVNGIQLLGTGSATISNNTIANIINRTSQGFLNGIVLNGGATATATVNANLVASNTITGFTGTGVLHGIRSQTGTNILTNNIVSLGDNNPVTIRAIGDDIGTIIFHNTVYVSGNPASGSHESSSLYCGNTNARDYRNNIIVNERSNTGTADGKHYGMQLTSSTGTLTCNGNNYFVNGTGTVLGRFGGTSGSGDKTSLPIVTGQDANSVVGNPSFANAGGTTDQSYVPASAALIGVNLLSTVPADYSGVSRTTTPTMGAHDFRIWNGANWNAAATADYNVRIDGNYSGGGFASRNLVVDAGKQLAITGGTLAVANNFTILSDATNGTGTYTNSGSLTVGGTTTVQQYVTAGRNWYMSSPITAGTASMLSRGDSVVQYNEVLKKWERVTGSLTPGRGYIQAAVATNGTTGSVDFSGVLNSGTIPVTITRTESGSNRGFNLVGNPYPSFLNSATFLSANNTKIEGNIWYRTHTGTAYEFNTYNSVSDQSVPKASNGSYIPPMQGFWVRALSTLNTLPEEDRKIEFTNAMRKHNDTTVVIKLRAPKAPVERQFIRLQVSNANLNDELLIYSDANASNNYDAYDAPKMMNTSSNSAAINLFTKAGVENLVIDGRTLLPLDVVIPVYFTTNAFASGYYSISANELTNLPSGVTVKIIDNGIETSLSDGGTYTFTADAGTTKTFGLVLRSPGAVTRIENGNADSFRVYANNNGQLVIMAPVKSNYAIYNTLGQLIQNGTLTSEHETLKTKLSSGVYVVKTENQSTRVIVK